MADQQCASKCDSGLSLRIQQLQITPRRALNNCSSVHTHGCALIHLRGQHVLYDVSKGHINVLLHCACKYGSGAWSPNHTINIATGAHKMRSCARPPVSTSPQRHEGKDVISPTVSVSVTHTICMPESMSPSDRVSKKAHSYVRPGTTRPTDSVSSRYRQRCARTDERRQQTGPKVTRSPSVPCPVFVYPARP